LTLKEGCVAGELPDLSSIPGTQSKPTLITPPQPAPQPAPAPEPEPEPETEVVTEAEEETETEVIPEETETELLPEETEEIEEQEIPTIGTKTKMSWGTVAVVAVIAIVAGIGGFVGAKSYRKKKDKQ